MTVEGSQIEAAFMGPLLPAPKSQKTDGGLGLLRVPLLCLRLLLSLNPKRLNQPNSPDEGKAKGDLFRPKTLNPNP